MIIVDTISKLDNIATVLVAHCVCGHYKKVDLKRVAERYGPDFPIRNVKHVLRCSACGHRPEKVQIIANAHVQPG